MSEATLSPIFAMGALLVAAGSVIAAVGAGAPAAHQLRATLLRWGPWAAFMVAAMAMAASLYYSEVAGFVPCEFCWYQRIAMYPLAVVLPVAAIGLALSVYHYQLQLFPEQGSSCTSGVPCSLRYVEEFGFVSIPFMAGSGFLAVLALQIGTLRARRSS